MNVYDFKQVVQNHMISSTKTKPNTNQATKTHINITKTIKQQSNFMQHCKVLLPNFVPSQ
jgi:hypothetical protein